jgi:hypothetical protein
MNVLINFIPYILLNALFRGSMVTGAAWLQGQHEIPKWHALPVLFIPVQPYDFE